MADPREVYAAYLRRCSEHRFDELAKFVAETVVVNGEPVGLPGHAAGLQAVVNAFADYHGDLRHLLADGLWISAHLRETAHTGIWAGIPATGRRVRTQELALYRLADHKIAEVWVTADNLHVIDQLRCGVR